MATRQLNTSIDQSLSDRLDKLARRTGRSKSFYAAEFIERGLNDLEDYFIAKDALDEFYSSDDQPIPLSDMDWDIRDQSVPE